MKKNVQKSDGFSIVELMVAAVIIAITVIAVVSMVRKSREMQLNDMHRQEVRAIINAQFEKYYGEDQYAVIPVIDSTSTVEINSRNGNPLNGILYMHVDSTNVTASGTPVPVKKVDLAVAWNEVGGERDSIFMSKWVAE